MACSSGCHTYLRSVYSRDTKWYLFWSRIIVSYEFYQAPLNEYAVQRRLLLLNTFIWHIPCNSIPKPRYPIFRYCGSTCTLFPKILREKDNVTAPHRKIYLDALISDFLPNRNWSFAKTHQWDADGKLWRFPAPKITTRYSTQITSSWKLHWQKALPLAWLSDGTQIEGDAVWRLRCSFEDGPSKHEWHTPILIALSTSIPDRKSSLLTDLVGTHIAAQLRAAEDQNAKNISPRVFSVRIILFDSGPLFESLSRFYKACALCPVV